MIFGNDRVMGFLRWFPQTQAKGSIIRNLGAMPTRPVPTYWVFAAAMTRGKSGTGAACRRPRQDFFTGKQASTGPKPGAAVAAVRLRFKSRAAGRGRHPSRIAGYGPGDESQTKSRNAGTASSAVHHRSPAGLDHHESGQLVGLKHQLAVVLREPNMFPSGRGRWMPKEFAGFVTPIGQEEADPGLL